MAELLLGAAAQGAAGLGAGLIGGGATAAAGILAPAAGFAGFGGLSSGVLNILQGVATAASVLGSLSAAGSEAQALTLQAQETELQAGQEQLGSTNRQTAMRRELLRVLGDNRVASAAAGIDLQGGLAQDIERSNKEAAARELSIERDDDSMRRALFKARANGLRSRGRDASTAGLVRAAGQFASFGTDLLQRG